jgi:hypothetical protein
MKAWLFTGYKGKRYYYCGKCKTCRKWYMNCWHPKVFIEVSLMGKYVYKTGEVA